MSFKTASAILRGRWLIESGWVQKNLPLILTAARNETRLSDDEREESPLPEKIQCRYAAVYSVYPRTDLSQVPLGSIAMVNITGPILKYGELSSWGSSHYAALINRLGESNNIAGILLNIDSPGGQADGTSMLADAILGAKKNKPVSAIVDDGMAASAAMWIASAADEIFVTKKTDMVGSIGVYTTIADWNAYYKDHHHLPVHDVYAPQSTDKNLDYREAIKGNDELVQQDLKVMAQEFIDTIKRNRAGKITGDDWSTGKTFFAKDAIKQGLIDGIKSFNDVVRRMNTEISNRKKTNTMAFNKTLKAAKAEEFEVVDGGFVLTEEHLNNTEANFAAYENSAILLNEQIADATAAKKKAEDDLAAANATITAREEQVSLLNDRLKALENEVPEQQQTTREKDDVGKTNRKHYTSDDDPFNKIADGIFGKPAEKK